MTKRYVKRETSAVPLNHDVKLKVDKQPIWRYTYEASIKGRKFYLFIDSKLDPMVDNTELMIHGCVGGKLTDEDLSMFDDAMTNDYE